MMVRACHDYETVREFMAWAISDEADRRIVARRVYMY